MLYRLDYTEPIEAVRDPILVGADLITRHMTTARARALELSAEHGRAIQISRIDKNGIMRATLIVNPDGTTQRPAGTKPADERSDHRTDGPCFCPACRADRRARRYSNRRTQGSSPLSPDQTIDGQG